MDGAAPPKPDTALDGPADALLRAELARGDAALAGTAPVLRHLVSREDQAIFADDILARVRGMVEDLAQQLIAAVDAASGEGDLPGHQALAAAIVADAGLLGHIHGLALESRMAAQLQERLHLDPVLSPLVQAMIGSPEPETAGLAMKLLAAQARFGNAQRRMTLPLAELPGDLLHTTLLALRAQDGSGDRTAQAEAAIRSAFDEGAGRLGLLARLVTEMGGGAIAALNLAHAGVAIFLTALAQATGECRDRTILAASDDHSARVVIMLSAAGIKQRAVEEQFVLLHPDKPFPRGADRLEAGQAIAMLHAAGLPA